MSSMDRRGFPYQQHSSPFTMDARLSIFGLASLLICAAGLHYDVINNQEWIFHFNQSSLSTVLVDNDADCTSSSCLRFPPNTVSIHRHFQSMFTTEASTSTIMDEFSVPSCDGLELLISDGRRAVVIFEEFSPLRSSAHSVWYWLDSCGLLKSDNSNVYFADMREFYNAETETYVSDAEICSMRSDAVAFVIHKQQVLNSLDDVWFLFPYNRVALASSINSLEDRRDDVSKSNKVGESVLIWNQLNSIYCTIRAVEKSKMNYRPNSWHIGTIGDIFKLENSFSDSLLNSEWSKSITQTTESKNSIEAMWSALDKYQDVRLLSSMLAESFGYIYMCVLPEHLPLAQWFVSYWKETPPVRFVNLFLRFRIITVESDNDNRVGIQSIPTLRSCWREMQRLAWAETGEYDFVVLLRGVAALASFLPPCIHHDVDLPACQVASHTISYSSYKRHTNEIGFAPFADETAKTRRLFCPVAAIVLGAINVCTDSTSMECAHNIRDNALTIMMGFSGVFHHLSNMVESLAQQEIKLSKQIISDDSYRVIVTRLLTDLSQRFDSSSYPTSSEYVVVDAAQLNFASIEGHYVLKDLVSSLEEMAIEDLLTLNLADIHDFCDDYQSLHFSLRAYCISIATFMFSVSPEGTELLSQYSHYGTPPLCDFQLAATDLFPPHSTQRQLFADRLLLFMHIPNMQNILFAQESVEIETLPVTDTRSKAWRALMLLYAEVSSVFVEDRVVSCQDGSQGQKDWAHPWLRQFFQEQDLVAWAALQLFLPVTLSDQCPSATAKDYVAGVHDVVYAKGRWFWHTWALVQTIQRMWYFYDEQVCSSQELQEIIVMIAKEFLMRTRANTKLFAELNKWELVASSDLLTAFISQLHMLMSNIEAYLRGGDVYGNIQSSGLQSLQLLLIALEQLQDAVQSHLAFLSAAEAASVWRTQRLLDVSLSFTPLITDSKSSPNSNVDIIKHPKKVLSNQSQVFVEQWLKTDRTLLRKNAQQNNVKIRIVTYGTEMTEGLSMLLTTSILSGLSLKILGLNETWKNYGDLIYGISNYLNTIPTSCPSSAINDDCLSDDDVLVVVDAYDVLLSPAMRRVAKDLLSVSDTPIVVSGEEYPYPEELLAWAYPHNYVNRKTRQKPDFSRAKFLNSGVIVGQVKYLRYFFQEWLRPQAHVYADDQHQWARYLVTSQAQGLVSTDSSMRLAFSTYKHERMSQGVMRVWTLVLFFYGEKEAHISYSSFHNTENTNTMVDSVQQLKQLIQYPILSIHGNNKESNTIYDTFATELKRVHQRFTDSPHREWLFQMLWAWYDGDMASLRVGMEGLLASRSQHTSDLVDSNSNNNDNNISIEDEMMTAFALYAEQFVRNET